MIGCFNCPITLSDYNCAERLVKNKAANAAIKCEEIIMVMTDRFIIQPHKVEYK